MHLRTTTTACTNHDISIPSRFKSCMLLLFIEIHPLCHSQRTIPLPRKHFAFLWYINYWIFHGGIQNTVHCNPVSLSLSMDPLAFHKILCIFMVHLLSDLFRGDKLLLPHLILHSNFHLFIHYFTSKQLLIDFYLYRAFTLPTMASIILASLNTVGLIFGGCCSNVSVSTAGLKLCGF